MHVSDGSKVADHCRAYALSTADDNDYKTTCDHIHNLKCDRCDIFPCVVQEIRTSIEGRVQGCRENMESGGGTNSKLESTHSTNLEKMYISIFFKCQ